MRELPEETIMKLWENSSHGTDRETVEMIYRQAYEDGLRDAPEGMMLVPIIPTWDMQIAASTAYREARDGHYTARMEQARDCWSVMLTASQKEAK